MENENDLEFDNPLLDDSDLPLNSQEIIEEENAIQEAIDREHHGY